MQGEAHGDVGVGVGRRLAGLLTCGSPGVFVGVGLGRPAGCRGLDGCVAVAVAVGVAVGWLPTRRLRGCGRSRGGGGRPIAGPVSV